jgi:hypothetical protein
MRLSGTVFTRHARRTNAASPLPPGCSAGHFSCRTVEHIAGSLKGVDSVQVHITGLFARVDTGDHEHIAVNRHQPMIVGSQGTSGIGISIRMFDPLQLVRVRQVVRFAATAQNDRGQDQKQLSQSSARDLLQ